MILDYFYSYFFILILYFYFQRFYCFLSLLFLVYYFFFLSLTVLRSEIRKCEVTKTFLFFDFYSFQMSFTSFNFFFLFIIFQLYLGSIVYNFLVLLNIKGFFNILFSEVTLIKYLFQIR